MNYKWYKDAADNFREAVAQGNIAHAMAVVDDIADRGFTREALQLGTELLAVKQRLV